MSMSNRLRRELGKNRELLWHLLEGEKCFFCKEEFVSPEQLPAFGNGRAFPVEVEITIHHKNGNHSDNAKPNRKLAHSNCHKVFHAKEVFSRWRKEVA